MRTSSAQIARIKNYEDFSATAYNDPPGSSTYSIGYGHQIQPGEESYYDNSITEDAATNLLQQDVVPLENQINADLNDTPSQNQFDSLVDFGYNEGSGSLAKLIDTWNNTGDASKVTAEMALYNKVSQGGALVVSQNLNDRRQAEISNFNSIIPPISPAVSTGAGIILVLLLFAWMVS